MDDLGLWISASGSASIHIEVGGLLPTHTFGKLFEVFVESMGPPETWSCLTHFWDKQMYRKLFKTTMPMRALNTMGEATPCMRQLFHRNIMDIYQIEGINVKLLRIDQHVVPGFPSQAMLKGGTYVAANTATFADERKTLFILSEYKRYRDPRKIEVTPQHHSLTIVPLIGTDAAHIMLIIELLLKIVQASFHPMNTMETNNVLEAYTALVGATKFIGPQPVAFRHAKFTTPLAWAVTPKLDGQRYLLFCTGTGKYIVSQKLATTKVDTAGPNGPGSESLFDCELVGRKLHVFDCYFSLGRDMRGLPLAARMKEARDRLTDTLDTPQFDVRLKAFYTTEPTGPARAAAHQKKYFAMCLARPGTDGVLFVHEGPVRGPPPLKYKPQITIDMRVVKRAVHTPRGERTILDLYVGALLNGNRKRMYTEIKFPVATKPVFESRDKPVVDKAIYECAFNVATNAFTLLRERTDKQKPNFETVALDNFGLIRAPEVPFTCGSDSPIHQ